MKNALTSFLLAALPLAAQPPRAEPVNEPLRQDPGNDFFQRAKNLHDMAGNAADQENKMQLYQRAAGLFEDYIREFGGHPNAEKAWFFKGESLYQSGLPNEGKAAFHTLLNRYPDGQWAAVAAFRLAYEHHGRREYAFAAPLFERYAANAAKPTERVRGTYNAADCYRLLGRDREALAAYRKVIDSPDGFSLAPSAKFYSGKVLLKTGKPKEALPLLEEVLSGTGNPGEMRGEAALDASTAAAEAGEHELAEKYLKFILTTPGLEAFRADAQTALMAQAFSRKQYKDVIDLYRRNTVGAEGPREAARLMLAARAMMELRQPMEAMQLFRDIEKLVPPENELAFLAAYYRLHCFFQIEGRHVPDQVDAFLQIYKKTRPPEDPKIQTVLLIKAETLFADKKNTEAAEAYREINASGLSEKNRPGLFYKRGWCFAETGDLQGAIRSLTEFITKYPQDERVPSALAKRAKCYAETGETAKAVLDFDQLTADTMPEEIAATAWLDSARMRRTENNFQDMILRYKGLLSKPKFSDPFKAEANYWIGWGLVKNNNQADSIPFLETARSLDAKNYAKHTGLLLCIVYGALQDAQKLAAEISLAIEQDYADEISDQTIQWTAMQAYGTGDFKSTARFLALIANPEEPRETETRVWRYLGKARFESGDPAGALVAAENVLAVEEDRGWKADALVDKGRALLALDRAALARVAANEAADLRPQGRTNALLQILSGDLFAKEGDLEKAAGAYNRFIQFGADPDLKPLALHKLIQILEQKGDAAEAGKYRDQLAKEFPNWKAP